MGLDHNGYMKFSEAASKPLRRCRGLTTADRLAGISDIRMFADGATVFDLGCNRGMVGYMLAEDGAKRVMGCDIDPDCIITARNVFADRRATEHQFEVVDLTGGERAITQAFGKRTGWKHDIVLMLATYHKLARVMEPAVLRSMMVYLGSVTDRFFGWRGYPEELKELDRALGESGLKRVQTSEIMFCVAGEPQECSAIWARR